MQKMLMVKKVQTLLIMPKCLKEKTVYARECARCHSTKVAPDAIQNDKDALEDFIVDTSLVEKTIGS